MLLTARVEGILYLNLSKDLPVEFTKLMGSSLEEILYKVWSDVRRDYIEVKRVDSFMIFSDRREKFPP